MKEFVFEVKVSTYYSVTTRAKTKSEAKWALFLLLMTSFC